MNTSRLIFEDLTGTTCDKVYQSDVHQYTEKDINWVETLDKRSISS